jgi:hypothetical protein
MSKNRDSTPKIKSEFELVPRLYCHVAQDETRLNELLGFCSHFGVQEVIVMDFCEDEFIMVPEERFRKQYEWMEKVIRRFEAHGIKASLNITVTFGHHGRSDASKRMKFQFAVGTNGVTSEATACALDAGYIEYIVKRYRAAAATGAWCIWVDDDFRYGPREGIDYSCFCPIHLAALSKRVGRSVERSEIVEMLQANAPSETQHHIRSEWRSLQRESLLSLGSLIRRVVKDVSPSTMLAFMCNGIANRSSDGMCMNDVINVIAADEEVIARPCMGPYTDVNRADYVYWMFLPQLECILFPKDSRLYGEIENSFRNRFTKSVWAMRFDCLIHIAQGIRKIAPSYQDSVPGSREEDRLFEDMFECNHPLLKSLACELPTKFAADTPTMLFSEDFAIFGGLDENNKTFSNLLMSAAHLTRLGIPIKFDTIMDNSIGIVAGKFAIGCLGQIQHKCNGLLIDALAAESLCRLGYSEAIGVEVSPLDGEHNKEVFIHDELNGNASGEYVQCRNRVLTTDLRCLKCLPGTQLLSELFDCAGRKISDGVCISEGVWGRVCVLPFSLASPRLMLIWRRKEQLFNIFNWLARKPLPAFVKNVADVVPFVYDRPNGSAVLLANLSIDKAVNVEVVLGRSFPHTARWQYLDKHGKVCALPSEYISYDNAVSVIKVPESIGIDFMDVRLFLVNT